MLQHHHKPCAIRQLRPHSPFLHWLVSCLFTRVYLHGSSAPLVTISLMSFQAYRYCESRCSDPCTKFSLTMANIVVNRTSYSDFIRLVFLDGAFPILSPPFTMTRRRRTHNRNIVLRLLDGSMHNEYHHNIHIAGTSLLHLPDRASNTTPCKHYCSLSTPIF